MFGIGHFYVLLIFMAVIAIPCLWVGIDAQRHGQIGLLWFLLSLLTFPVGAIIWLVVRATTYRPGPPAFTPPPAPPAPPPA